MGTFRQRAAALLEQIRNPAEDDYEQDVRRRIGFKRLLFLIPFIIAAAVLLILAFK